MPESRRDITITQGARFRLAVQVTDAGLPLALDGISLQAQVRAGPLVTDELLAELTCTPDDDQVANPGKAILSLTTSTTTALAPGNYSWDLFLVDADGERDRLLFGSAEVESHTTAPPEVP